jgi:hypothetical protein
MDKKEMRNERRNAESFYRDVETKNKQESVVRRMIGV